MGMGGESSKKQLFGNLVNSFQNETKENFDK